MIAAPIPKTKKNVRRLKKVKQILDSYPDLSPEFKLGFKLFVNRIIDDVRARKIESYNDLIDYLRDKANAAVDNNYTLSDFECHNAKFLIRCLAERAKIRRKSKYKGSLVA